MFDAERYPGSRTILGRLLRLPLRLVPKGSIVRILQGPLRGKRWIVGSGIHRLWLGRYEPAKMKLAASLTGDKDVVFDIGANVGIYTLLFSDRVGPTGRVVAFEPSVRNVAQLRRHLELNHAENVDVVEGAVSDVVGQSAFSDISGSCTGRLDADGDVLVMTTTIDHFVQSSGLSPSLIKIDVEGSEADVLRGAIGTLRHNRPLLLVATHSPAVKSRCAMLLIDCGYHVDRISDGRMVHEDELIGRPLSDLALEEQS